MAITRLSSGGYGAAAYAGFSPKADSDLTAHNPGLITRLVSGGYGGRRNATFIAKTDASASGSSSDWLIIARRRGRR